MHVSSLPEAVTWKRTGRDSNLRPFGSRANAYTVKLAFHGADMDTDTDSPNTATVLRPTHAISSYRRVGRVGVRLRVGVGVGVVEFQHIGSAVRVSVAVC